MVVDANMDAIDEYVVQLRGMRRATGGEAGQKFRRKRFFRLPWGSGRDDAEAAASAAPEEPVKEYSEFRMPQRGSHVHWGGALNAKGQNKRGQQKLQCIGRRVDLQSSQVENILDVMQKLVKEELSSLSCGARCGCLTSFSLKLEPTSCSGVGKMDTSDLRIDQYAVQSFGDTHIPENHTSYWMTANCGEVVTYPANRDTDDLQQMLDMECRRCLFMTFVMASGLRLVGERSCWPLLELFLVPWMPIHPHRHGQNTIPRWRRWSHMALKIGVALSTRFCSSFLGPFLTAHAVLSLGSSRPINAGTGQSCLSANRGSREIPSSLLPHSALRSQGAPHLQALDRHSGKDCVTPSREMPKIGQIEIAEGNPVRQSGDNEECSHDPVKKPPSLKRHDYAGILESVDGRRRSCQEREVDFVAQGLIEQGGQIVDSSCTTSYPTLPEMQEQDQICKLGDASFEVWAPALCPTDQAVAPLTTDGPSFDIDMVGVSSSTDAMLRDTPSHDDMTEDVASSQCLTELPVVETSVLGGLSPGNRMQSQAEQFQVTESRVLNGYISEVKWLSSELEYADSLPVSGSQPSCPDHTRMQGEDVLTSQSLHPCFLVDTDEQNPPNSNQKVGGALESKDVITVNHGRPIEGNEDVDSPLAVPLNGKGTWVESQTNQFLCTPTSTAITDQVNCSFQDTFSRELSLCPLSQCGGNMKPNVSALHDVCRDNIGQCGPDAHTVIEIAIENEAGCLQQMAEVDNTNAPASSFNTKVDDKWSDFTGPESSQIYGVGTASLTSSTSSSSLGFTDSEDEIVPSADSLQAMLPAEDPAFQVSGDPFTEGHMGGITLTRTTDARELPSRQQSEVDNSPGTAQTAQNTVKAGHVFSHSDHPLCVAMRSRRHANEDQNYWEFSALQTPPWGDLVFWHGHCREGRPTLCVLLGKAVCTLPSSLLGSIITVIVSHMELAELNLFAGSAQQMNLLLDLSGLGLLRMPPMDILQRLGTVINRDYAGRGGSVYVLNAPVMLSIVVSAIKGVILKPSYNRGAMIEKGFLDSKESILVLGRRSIQALEKYFPEHMLHPHFGGQCSCGKSSRLCNVGYHFLMRR